MRSVECEVWSVKSAVEVWSVEGKTQLGQGVFELYIIYVGKFPPPACPGLCYLELDSDFDSNLDLDR